MDLRMTVEPLDGPVRQGARTTLVVRVANPGPEHLVLDDLRADGPHDDAVRWRRHPDGAIVYDAVEDAYRHMSVMAMRSSIPLDYGIVPPRAGAQTFLHVKSLGLGPRTVRLVARGHVLPTDALGERLYAAPDEVQGSTSVFERTSDPERARGGVIVRRAGLVAAEGRLDVPLEVAPDDEAPSAAALELVGAGARLVDRLRRLGGAWVVQAQDGAVHVVKGARVVRCPPGSIAAGTWTGLDERMPFDPVFVMLRSDAARASREGLPFTGRDPQLALPSAAVWDLLERLAQRGLTASWGRHTALNDGLIIR